MKMKMKGARYIYIYIYIGIWILRNYNWVLGNKSATKGFMRMLLAKKFKKILFTGRR